MHISTHRETIKLFCVCILLTFVTADTETGGISSLQTQESGEILQLVMVAFSSHMRILGEVSVDLSLFVCLFVF